MPYYIYIYRFYYTKRNLYKQFYNENVRLFTLILALFFGVWYNDTGNVLKIYFQAIRFPYDNCL